MAPRNLRVNDDGHAPTFGAGDGIQVSWTLTDERRPLVPVTDVLAAVITGTVLEARSLGGALLGTFTFADATSPRTISGPELVAAIGPETSFELRAWFQRGGLRSLDHDTLKVTQV